MDRKAAKLLKLAGPIQKVVIEAFRIELAREPIVFE